MNWLGSATALTLVVLLAACEQLPPPKTGGAQRSLAGGAASPQTEPSPGLAVLGPREQPVPPLPPPRPVARGSVVDPGPAAQASGDAESPVGGETREKPPFGELVGLNADELLRQMGSPSEVRIQSPATIWEYRFSGCSLALFLFRDVNNQLLKALTFETAGLDVDTTVGRDERCPDPIAEKVADG
ncbi:MAG: hypothetical protein DHS20C03_06200 [Minwuia thermotolerans]|nr:MAG: hypothetical protein DHS20C03_06200 [Minwuia thermotolerans]